MSTDRARFIAGLIDCWRIHGTVVGGQVIERPGVFTCFTNAPQTHFNPTIIWSEVSNPSVVLAELEDQYRSRGLGFGFEILDGACPDTELAALAAGLELKDEQPCMLLDPIDPPAMPSSVHTVTTVEMLDQLIGVQALGFGDDPDGLRAFMPPEVLDSQEHLLLVVNENEPVAGSIMIPAGAIAGVFGVATLPDKRGAGHGTAATIAAVRAAADAGCDAAYLQASAMGFPIYERMGFRTLFTARIYTRP